MKKTLALLGLASFSLQANLFANKKPFVKLDEDQLQKIEEALEQNSPDAELETQLADAKTTVSGVVNAVEQALEVAGLEGSENLVDNIVLLGNKCEEYATNTNRHSFPNNSGNQEPTDELVEGYIDPNDGHNQLLKSL